MLEVAGRADLKSDLLQELERQKSTLVSFRNNPNVQSEMLDNVIEEVDQVSSALMACTGKTGQHIRENEWLMSIRGRTIIPAVPVNLIYPVIMRGSTKRRNSVCAISNNGLHRLRHYLQQFRWYCACCANPAPRRV
jgi:cell division FtsZ-interacting protein ZapD